MLHKITKKILFSFFISLFISNSITFAATNQGFGLTPAYKNLSNNPYYSYQIAPGGMIKDGITVQNLEKNPIELKISFNSEMKEDFVTFEKESLILMPFQFETINYEISVPKQLKESEITGQITVQKVNANAKNSDGNFLAFSLAVAKEINLDISNSYKNFFSRVPSEPNTINEKDNYSFPKETILLLITLFLILLITFSKESK